MADSNSLDISKKIADHLKKMIESDTASKPVIVDHLKNALKRIAEKDEEEKTVVEYVFVPEDRGQAKRDRLNSCTASFSLDTSATATEDGNIEIPVDIPDASVHVCVDCDVEIPVVDGEEFRAALVRHYSNDPHKQQPRVATVSEVVLPTLSRKFAAMMRTEPVGRDADIINEAHKQKIAESLLALEPSRVDVANLIAAYQTFCTVLQTKVATLDLLTASKVITPILVSIKDNVNQTASETTKTNEEDETVNHENHATASDPDAKTEMKKLKYYQPIASKIDELLERHKLVLLTDERGGKPAYFCIACEYYTLRFGYETIVAHVFNETHISALAKMLLSDRSIAHGFTVVSPDTIRDLNGKFFNDTMRIRGSNDEYNCLICRLNVTGFDAALAHAFDEGHMTKLSGKFYFKMRDDKDVNWGAKSLDWKSFNIPSGKTLQPNEHIVVENFIKPLAKTLSQCQCCTATFKGQRQLVFNHVRQKKHLRNAVPRRLAISFGNFVRPLEYFSSLGHFYTCIICETFTESMMLNFSDIYDHANTDLHISAVSKLLRLFSGNFMEMDLSILTRQGMITTDDVFGCILCRVPFASSQAAIEHILIDIDHQNNIAARDYDAFKPHIVNYLLKSTPIRVENNEYQCVICSLSLPTNNALLAHLTFADHIYDRIEPEAVFRLYLLLKQNAKTCKENHIVVRNVTVVECQKCASYFTPDENIRSHIASAKHKG